MHELIEALVNITHEASAHDNRHASIVQALSALLMQKLATHGCTLPTAEIASLLQTDIELNAQGLAIWLDHTASTTR